MERIKKNDDFVAKLQEELLLLHLLETVFLDDLDAYDLWLELKHDLWLELKHREEDDNW